MTTDVKISAQTSASALTGVELLPGVQSGAGVSITANQLKTWASSSPTLVTPTLGVAQATSIQFTDATLIRDAANVLALRNGTNTQTFRLYETYTDASNYSGLFLNGGNSGDAVIQATAAGTGTGKNIAFYVGSSARWRMTTSGHFIAGTNNTYDIGAAGATQPRNIYAGTQFLGTAGNATNPTYSFDGDTNNGFYAPSADRLAWVAGGTPTWRTSSSVFNLSSAMSLNWVNTTNADTGTADTSLSRDAAGVIDVGTGAAGSVAGTLQLTQLSVFNATPAERIRLNSTLGVHVASSMVIGWANATTVGTADLALSRISAGVLGLGNGTAADLTGELQLNKVTLNNAGVITWASGPTLGKNGTNSVYWQNNAGSGLVRLNIDGNGLWRWGGPDLASPVAQAFAFSSVVAGTSNTAGVNTTFDMSQGTGTGAGGSFIVRVAPAGSTGTSQNALAAALTIDSTKTVTLATGLVAGNGANASGITTTYGFGFVNQGRITSPSDGVFTLVNAAVTDFSRLQLGGTTSSFPAIKRNAAAINFRLADDTADAAISALALTLPGDNTSTSTLIWAGGTRLYSTGNGNLISTNNAATDFGRFMLGGTTSSFPALKRATVNVEARLADDSAYTGIKGKLTTDTSATTGLTAGVLAATTNASIVLYDGSGQAYRVPCII